MTELPVREMVLYKHGVGFFIRRGTLNTDEIALVFHQDEINDVLKSLAVFDYAGGHVLGIHYQTPMDKAARLANTSIRLSDEASIANLLRDLRGRLAHLTFETTPGTLEHVTGRVIGMDRPTDDLDEQSISILVQQPPPPPQTPPQPPQAIAPAPEAAASAANPPNPMDGSVRVFRFKLLRSLRIEDPQSKRDLTYFLDTSMSEDDRRTVYVRLSAGDHDLFVSYVAPTPTWRVSYRVIAESDESGKAGRALLQGWGLFDNRLEEDLEAVRVTLVAGQPISFIYDLYTSRIPQRRTVQDEARIAPGPVEYMPMMEADEGESATIAPFRRSMVDETGTTGAGRKRAMFQKVSPMATNKLMDRMRPSPGDMRAQMAQAVASIASAKEAGEFFQYVVTNPVSVKRGESALVPIISSEVNYTRELLYNGEKLPNHPVASLRFDNLTGLTLERGPVTVVEDSDYKGEAVIPFTKDGNQIYLPYAVEMGVKITEHKYDTVQVNGLKIEGAFLVYEEYQIEQVTYIAENTTAHPVTVTIEATIHAGNELFDTPAPDVENASEHRWRLDVPARGKAEFVRKERQMQWRHQELRRLDYASLQRFMENRWLDENTYDQLADMLDHLSLIIRARVNREDLADERKLLYEQQQQLRENLKTLQPTGQEAGFRNRLLGQLEGSQNRLDEIEQMLEDISRRIAESEERITAIIEGLGKKEKE